MATSKTSYSPIWSAVIALAITAVALGCGYLLWQSILAPNNPIEKGGVSAAVPSGWIVQKGIEGETRLFSASNPLQPHLQYQVLRLPMGDGMGLADVVSGRNLDRATRLSAYRVLDQVDVQVGGRSAFKVHFAYVDASAAGSIPVVIEGADYYFTDSASVIVASLEDASGNYADSLPKFLDFIGALKFEGGAQ
jgi:hypothetical protein